jgi:ABC-type maltose transport system permease subunit
MGIGGRYGFPSRTISRFRLRFENSVMGMTANDGKKPMAIIASLFVQFRQNGAIDAYRIAIVPTVVFALLLTVVILSFVNVYKVDYAVQVAAAVVTIPLVMLVLICQRRVVSGLTDGVTER